MLQKVEGDIHKVTVGDPEIDPKTGQNMYPISWVGFGPEHDEWRTAEQLAEFGMEGQLPSAQQQQQQQQQQGQRYRKQPLPKNAGAATGEVKRRRKN